MLVSDEQLEIRLKSVKKKLKSINPVHRVAIDSLTRKILSGNPEKRNVEVVPEGYSACPGCGHLYPTRIKLFEHIRQFHPALSDDASEIASEKTTSITEKEAFDRSLEKLIELSLKHHEIWEKYRLEVLTETAESTLFPENITPRDLAEKLGIKLFALNKILVEQNISTDINRPMTRENLHKLSMLIGFHFEYTND